MEKTGSISFGILVMPILLGEIIAHRIEKPIY
jgi:hypothetical protein